MRILPVVFELLRGAKKLTGLFFGAPLSKQRIVVFLDWQNVYRGARRAFFSETDPHIYGQTHPLKLAELITDRKQKDGDYYLGAVHLYTGRPSSSKDQATYSAHMRQCHAWARQAIKINYRPLRYPKNWPDEMAQEKGIDVSIAIDFVRMAYRNEYDVGILFSCDTDLVPALEMVCQEYPKRTVEVAAWKSPKVSSRLRVRGANIWCHLLHKEDYDICADHDDYRPSFSSSDAAVPDGHATINDLKKKFNKTT